MSSCHSTEASWVGSVPPTASSCVRGPSCVRLAQTVTLSPRLLGPTRLRVPQKPGLTNDN